ncbi:DUF1572 family protein [uncultured Mucilaginibacter sp.]|uniref:DinB family protein n=1 Tax=uncultured Mucilaginibacter sp. TaxID=797541 RepID=UPI0025DAD194|nr:DUF1572 family protein [uncultured Mucilaginibacter sp.]
MDNFFAELFERELLKLKDELNKFKDENNIWQATDGITNTAGTLTLHLLGNLNFTIGTQLGGTGYVRNREQEFSLTGVSREKLVADIEKTIEVIRFSFETVNQAKLDETYTLEMIGQHSTGWYLTFFYGHFTYHLGQINYLRRILEAE